MGGRIVGAVVLKVEKHNCLLQELHSTKGWKPPHWESVYNDRFRRWWPVVGAFHRVKSIQAHALNSGRLERHRRPWENTPVDLMRHGWYRRKMMAEAEA